jgi:hypothetical protein
MATVCLLPLNSHAERPYDVVFELHVCMILSENYARCRQKLSKVMGMEVLLTLEKAKTSMGGARYEMCCCTVLCINCVSNDG